MLIHNNQYNKIYNNIAEVTDNVITTFQPLLIRKPKFDRDIFSKEFLHTDAKKKNFLHKFANLHEHYHLMYNILDLNILKALPLDKLKTLFLLSSTKDATGMLRFTPAQTLYTANLEEQTFNFIKPFARQKNSNELFIYKFNDIISLAKFSKKQQENAMELFEYKLNAQDLIGICKDENIKISALKKRLDTIKSIFSNNIYNIRINKYKNDYVIALTTEKEHKTRCYVFDKNFNLKPEYKSDIDFTKGALKDTGIFKLFKRKSPGINKPDNSIKVSINEHIEALDKINEYADYLKKELKEQYKHNFYVLTQGNGNLIDREIKFPENLLVDYWKRGAISEEDLIKICEEHAELIPQNDFKYFALNKVKMTSYDNERYLKIRKNSITAKAVDIDSGYYKKVLDKVLKTETEKIKNIKAQKRMIVIDGLPGAGKSTIINKILKNDKNLFYTPDSDDIKAAFSEVYNNGEGANLVHKASGNILKNEILPRVFKQGKNIIFQTTGNYVSINKVIQQAKNHGYNIDFIHITTPKNISLERSIIRFNQHGRFLDPLVTMSIYNCNNKEKSYAARIFSYNKNINKSCIFENGKFYCIKDGNIEAKQSLDSIL